MISVPHKQIINPERRMRKKVRADIKEQIRRLIKRSPTNKDRRAEKKHEAESRVVVRTSNTNSTSACLVRKKCVWSRPPSHPTLAAPREPQNTVTRNSFLRALFHLIFFFSKHPRNEKSPSCQAPPRRCSRRFGALARRRLKEPVICCALPKTSHGTCSSLLTCQVLGWSLTASQSAQRFVFYFSAEPGNFR